MSARRHGTAVSAVLLVGLLAAAGPVRAGDTSGDGLGRYLVRVQVDGSARFVPTEVVPAPGAEATAEPRERDLDLRFGLTARTRGLGLRWLSSDLRATFHLDAERDPAASLTEGRPSVLYDTWDASRGVDRFLRIYRLSVAADPLPGKLPAISIGRHEHFSSYLMRYDGVRFTWRDVGRLIESVAFAGRRVTFTGAPLLSAVAGGSMAWRLATTTSLRVEHLYYVRHLTTARLAWVAPAELVSADRPRVRAAMMEASLLDGRPRHLSMAGTVVSDRHGASIQAEAYLRLLAGIDDFLLDMTSSDFIVRPDVASRLRLSRVARFWELDLRGDKSFFQGRLVTSLEIRFRAVLDLDDRDTYNPSSLGAWGSLDLRDLPWRGAFAGLSVGVWYGLLLVPLPEVGESEVDDLNGVGETGMRFVTFELGHRLRKPFPVRLRASIDYRAYDARTRWARLGNLNMLGASFRADARPVPWLFVRLAYDIGETLPFLYGGIPGVAHAVRLTVGGELR